MHYIIHSAGIKQSYEKEGGTEIWQIYEKISEAEKYLRLRLKI